MHQGHGRRAVGTGGNAAKSPHSGIRRSSSMVVNRMGNSVDAPLISERFPEKACDCLLFRADGIGVDFRRAQSRMAQPTSYHGDRYAAL